MRLTLEVFFSVLAVIIIVDHQVEVVAMRAAGPVLHLPCPLLHESGAERATDKSANSGQCCSS